MRPTTTKRRREARPCELPEATSVVASGTGWQRPLDFPLRTVRILCFFLPPFFPFPTPLSFPSVPSSLPFPSPASLVVRRIPLLGRFQRATSYAFMESSARGPCGGPGSGRSPGQAALPCRLPLTLHRELSGQPGKPDLSQDRGPGVDSTPRRTP